MRTVKTDYLFTVYHVELYRSSGALRVNPGVHDIVGGFLSLLVEILVSSQEGKYQHDCI